MHTCRGPSYLPELDAMLMKHLEGSQERISLGTSTFKHRIHVHLAIICWLPKAATDWNRPSWEMGGLQLGVEVGARGASDCLQVKIACGIQCSSRRR
jgi:hypothetical protein